MNKEAPLFRKSRAFEDLRQLPPPESLCAMNRALRHPIGFWNQLLSWPGKRIVRKTSCTRPGSKRSSECAESRRVSPSATTCAYRVLKRLSWNQHRIKRDSESLLGLFDASFNSLSTIRCRVGRGVDGFGLRGLSTGTEAGSSPASGPEVFALSAIPTQPALLPDPFLHARKNRQIAWHHAVDGCI